MIGEKLLHGGDYNPEQWLESQDILEEDIRLMKQAHINCVTLGVFSWSMLEPEEGAYDFQWLKDIIDRLYREGICVILATPSGAMPHWLSQKYPEVMQVHADGKRNLPGKRHNFCYTSPVMREKIRQLDEKLSECFGSHPAVVLWHISNEFGGNFGDSSCHCELCQKEFREWLKKRYGTLDALNHAWWNRFWSHVYTDWDQIHSPMPHGEALSHGLNLDWKRFVTERMMDFCSHEIQAVRTHSSLPVTANFMDFFKGLDYGKFQECLNLVSWDSYPFWHSSRDQVPEAVRAAANHSLMRSLKKQPFLLMESTPSCVNWKAHNPLKRPGMHMLSSMQAVAHGSDSVQYFQWRKSRGAFEKFHGAVLDHKNGADTRTYREVSEVGERLERLTNAVEGSVNRPRAAIVFDWENWWALEDSAGPRLEWDYVGEILKHYQVFWEAGVEVDFVHMGQELDGYALVLAPLNYLYRQGYAEKVRQYTAKGGIYVTTYFSGIVDDTDLCFLRHHPLEDVLGIVQEEIDAPGEEYENSISYQGTEYPVGGIREVIHPKEDTKVLAVYKEDFYAGMPVVTAHPYKEGTAWYLAAEMDLKFLRQWYKELCVQAELYNALGAELPYGVTVTQRQGGENPVFVMNFSEKPVILMPQGEWEDVDTKERIFDRFTLEAYSCRVLKKK